jgi:hypothetical protein
MRVNTSIAIFIAGALAFVAGPAAANTITFIPGTYYLAENYGATPDHTLVITVSNGVADFTLIGDDPSETASLPDVATPSSGGADDPTFLSTAASANWDTNTYPYLVFYSTADQGGLEAYGDSDIFNLYQSDEGPGQVYSVAPEPAAWALMLAGLFTLGAVLRGRRRQVVFQSPASAVLP